MKRRILLHVGTPKTGTSHLQDVLFRNRQALARQGVSYPADRFDGHFLAALDLMRLPWGGLETEAVGAWDRLADEVRTSRTGRESTWAHDGEEPDQLPPAHTVIISHEILATASRTQVGRVLESLGADDPKTEVHVILSVRDLARQIPAEWQENVKHRSGLSYGRFLERIEDPERSTRIGTWFWGVQEIPDILDRWARDLPPEQVHLVTVPAPGAPTGLLWERFSQAFSLSGLDLDLHAERANPSLGVPEIALLRRINRRATKVLEPADYRPLVRELLAHQTLSRRTKSPRLGLPPAARAWVTELEQAWVGEIKRRDYAVIGDLDDLIGAAPEAAYADPDSPSERAVAAAGVTAITALLLENARMRGEEARLHEELDHTRAELDHARRGSVHAVRAWVVGKLESGRVGRLLTRGYRALLGRNSPSA